MNEKKIAIIFGGHSTEYEVSLQSAASVFENINTTEFEVSKYTMSPPPVNQRKSVCRRMRYISFPATT